jgi:hypothetical protein
MPNAWFRFYVSALNNVKVQTLPDSLFRIWVNILCVASGRDGILPDEKALAFELRISVPEALSACSALVDAKLLDRSKGGKLSPHDWNSLQYKSDSSTERSRKHRLQRCKNVPATPPDQIQSRTDTEQRERARAETATPPRALMPRKPDFDAFEETDRGPEVSRLASDLMEAHPVKGRLVAAEQALAAVLFIESDFDGTIAKFRAHHAAWQPEFMLRIANRRHVPSLDRWVLDGDWRHPPNAAHTALASAPTPQRGPQRVDVLALGRKLQAEEDAKKGLS